MAYSKTVWENLPSTNTPVNATNLNKIENELEYLDNKEKTYWIPVSIGTSIGWYLAASGTLSGYTNASIILSIQGMFEQVSGGLLYINIRSDSTTGLAIQNFKWIGNTGIKSKDLKLQIDGQNFYLYFRTSIPYEQYHIKIIQQSNLGTHNENMLTMYYPENNQTVSEPTGINPIDGYSTSLEVRVGTWINGEPLYRKVYSGTVSNIASLCNADSKNLVVNIYGYAQTSTNGVYMPLNNSFSDADFRWTSWFDLYYGIAFEFGNNFSSNSVVVVVVEYTKNN